MRERENLATVWECGQFFMFNHGTNIYKYIAHFDLGISHASIKFLKLQTTWDIPLENADGAEKLCWADFTKSTVSSLSFYPDFCEQIKLFIWCVYSTKKSITITWCRAITKTIHDKKLLRVFYHVWKFFHAIILSSQQTNGLNEMQTKWSWSCEVVGQLYWREWSSHSPRG